MHAFAVLSVCFATILAAQEPHAILPNRGQWPAHVQAAARHGAQTTWLTDTGWTTRVVASDWRPDPRGDDGPGASLPDFRSAVVEVEFVGGTAAVSEFADPLPGIVAFLLGNDPRHHAGAVPRFGRALRRDLWPGVDLSFATRAGELAYDLHFAPHVAAGTARFTLRGARSVRIADDGALELDLGFGTLRHGAPLAWQTQADGQRRAVPVRFVREGDAVSFAVVDRDPECELVIDPPLVWCTLLGGVANENCGVRQSLDRRADGTTVVCGWTASWAFPGGPLNGATDGFVTAVDSIGTPLWSALIGGTGVTDESFSACRWDGQGRVLFCGFSGSWDFPTSPGCYQNTNRGPLGFGLVGDMVVGRLVLTPTITLDWSTFLGGYGPDRANGLTVLPGDKVAVVGWSNSTPPEMWTHPGAWQPSPAGGFDAYQAVLYPDAPTAQQQLEYATWWGGSSDEVPGCIVYDALGRLVVGGWTPSANIVMTSNALQPAYQGGTIDGYVTCFDSTLSGLMYATYLGGPGADQANDLTVDAQGRFVIGNWTSGFSFPMPAGAWQTAPASGADDGFALVLDPFASPAQQIVWGTYIGGTMSDGVNGIALDAAGRITVVGSMHGTAAGVTTFPSTSWPLQAFVGGPGGTTGHSDAFVARFDSRRQGAEQLVYCTCLGGSGYDYGYDVVLDELARPIVVGPTNSALFQGQANHGNQDVFRVKIDLLATVADRFGVASPACASTFSDAYHRQTPGVFDLTLVCTSAPPTALGLLVFGTPDVPGTPVPPLGVTCHLQLGQPLITLTVFSDAEGAASQRLLGNGFVPPIGLAAQWVWLGGCAPFTTSDALGL